MFLSSPSGKALIVSRKVVVFVNSHYIEGILAKIVFPFEHFAVRNEFHNQANLESRRQTAQRFNR
jgi:hypothetical protein